MCRVRGERVQYGLCASTRAVVRCGPLVHCPGASHMHVHARRACLCLQQGYAFVYMRYEEDGDYAIKKLDGMEWGYKKRPLRLQWSKVCERAPAWPASRLPTEAPCAHVLPVTIACVGTPACMRACHVCKPVPLRIRVHARVRACAPKAARARVRASWRAGPSAKQWRVVPGTRRQSRGSPCARAAQHRALFCTPGGARKPCAD